MVKILSREPVRAYLYGVMVPGLALCVAYGLIDGAQLALWLAAGAAILGVPATELARNAVTPTRPRGAHAQQ